MINKKILYFIFFCFINLIPVLVYSDISDYTDSTIAGWGDFDSLLNDNLVGSGGHNPVTNDKCTYWSVPAIYSSTPRYSTYSVDEMGFYTTGLQSDGSILIFIPDGDTDYYFGLSMSPTTSDCNTTDSDNDGIMDVDDNYPNGYNQPTDTDGDGILDNADLYPDDPTSYKYKIFSEILDINGNVVRIGIETDRGDYFYFGTRPEDMTDYQDKVNIGGIWNDDVFLQAHPLLGGGGIEKTVATGGQVSDDLNEQGNNGKAPDASPGTSTGMGDGEVSVEGDTDGDLQKKIVDNTGDIAKNQGRIGDYLKQNNDLLAGLGKKLDIIGSGIGRGGSGVVIGTGEETTGPTAEEIGQAVKDKLEDPTNTYDSTTTDNLDDFVVDSGTLEGIGTKYSNRVTQFTDVIKTSPLFTLSSDLFSPPTSSTSSTTIGIGKWGGSTNNSVTIDMSDYDVIWSVLGSVLLIMASYAAFKIVVVKHA